MDQRTVRVAVIALLCVVAVGAAAATLNATQRSGSLGTGSNGEAGVADSEGDSVVPLQDRGDLQVESGQRGSVCIEQLRSPLVVLSLVLVLLGVGAVIAYRTNVLIAGATVLTISLLGGIPYAMLAACTEPSAPEQGAADPGLNSSLPQGGGGVPGSTSGPTPVPPSTLVLILLGGILLVAVVAIVYSTGDDDVEQIQPEPPEEDEERIEEIARVAGEAADRIDADGDVDNEVYRAWREMVGLLAVDNPAATTPGEFADAAVDAGMSADDVRELTDLFEAVRYGDSDPTADREDRAVAALRRVERTYADDDGDGDGSRGPADSESEDEGKR